MVTEVLPLPIAEFLIRRGFCSCLINSFYVSLSNRVGRSLFAPDPLSETQHVQNQSVLGVSHFNHVFLQNLNFKNDVKQNLTCLSNRAVEWYRSNTWNFLFLLGGAHLWLIVEITHQSFNS